MTTDLSSEFAFRFSTTIENAGIASYVASIAIIPPEIIEQLSSDKIIRVNGRFQNTFHYNLAIQPKRIGEKYLSINASTLKELSPEYALEILLQRKTPAKYEVNNFCSCIIYPI